MSEINFDIEAKELGSKPKQDYKLNIDLGDDAPPNIEEDGRPFDEAAQDIAQEQAQKKEGGAFESGARMFLRLDNVVVPRISSFLLKEDHRKFEMAKDDQELLVELLVPVLEYHKFKPNDPTLFFVIAYIVIRFEPIWDAKTKSNKQNKHARAAREMQAKQATTVYEDDDLPITPADEVDDAGNTIKTAEKHYYKDGDLATGEIRICKHRNCNHALKKTQRKFCSHSCKAYEQALVVNDSKE